MQKREQLLRHWLTQVLAGESYVLELASGDASFRQYFRLQRPGQDSLIVMDAPPERENTEPYIRIAGMLKEAGISVPEIYAINREQGFLLLSDLGVIQYAARLSPTTVDALYADALDALFVMQAHDYSQIATLPAYDQALLERELGIFVEWFLGQFLDFNNADCQHPVLHDCFRTLVENALAQPRVFVHRDYHSRNLMVLPQANPGVLDFQDAVFGPVTYDLVSLLRDCYVAWPAERVSAWAQAYWRRLYDAGTVSVSFVEFMNWFDLMGMQRHLKAIGIFARLKLRDGKAGYIADIPRVLDYVLDVTDRHELLAEFGQFLRARVVPRFAARSVS